MQLNINIYIYIHACTYIYDLSECMSCDVAQGLKHLTLETLDISKDLTMAPRGKKWHVKFFEGDRVHHWWTGRQGTVTTWTSGSHMAILFDDGRQENRRKTAYIKGESTWKTWKTWK